MSGELPALELHAEIEKPDGTTYRWDANAGPQDRPQGIQFQTKLMDGFGTGGCTLHRSIDREYPDLEVDDTVRFIAADGSIVYEGRGARFPRELGDAGHRITAEAVGWMTHARDRPFTAVFVDRDLDGWKPASASRKSDLLANGWRVTDPSVASDNDGDAPALQQTIRLSGDDTPICEALYDAGPGNLISAVYYDYLVRAASSSATFSLRLGYADTDGLASRTDTGDLWDTEGFTHAALSGTSSPGRYVFVQWLYDSAAAAGPGTDRTVFWRDLTVYGNHGLPLIGPSNPQGVRGSDVIKHIAARWAPKLDTSGVQRTEHVIEQLAFHDLTVPYDAWLKLNAYERWHLAVWENKRLHYEPLALDTHHWEVRADEPGVRVQYEGPSIESTATGVIVRFQNVGTKAADMVGPDDDLSLGDTSGRVQAVQLSDPNSRAGAIRIGGKVLYELNRDRRPSRITVRGHIRDATGNWQQAWRPRAGESVLVTSQVDTGPRLIHETGWDHDSRTLTLTLDAQAKTVDAILDQLGVEGRAA